MFYGRLKQGDGRSNNQLLINISPLTIIASTIIDFELWRAAEETFKDEVKELERWGLARQPAAKDHWAAWNAQFR